MVSLMPYDELSAVEWNQANAALKAWALVELAPWMRPAHNLPHAPCEKLRYFAVEQNANLLNATYPWVFVLDVSNCEVVVRAKPGLYTEEQMHDGTIAYIGRIIHYKHFIQEVLDHYPIAGVWSIVLDASDGGIVDCDAPVFAFQKVIGSRKILLPDPEFFYMHFYNKSDYHDLTPYLEKIDKAVFVGSTTGGGIITKTAIREGLIPRLQSALAFRNSQEVNFQLPALVHCESAEVEAEIRALGFGVGRLDWPQQLLYKSLISMDGNGAACSRLALGLKSNSVVLKYDSNCLLFYFHGLTPWLHYVPVSEDKDVTEAVIEQRVHPERYAFIASESFDFFHRYLTKGALLTYTSLLLRLYATAYKQPSD